MHHGWRAAALALCLALGSPACAGSSGDATPPPTGNNPPPEEPESPNPPSPPPPTSPEPPPSPPPGPADPQSSRPRRRRARALHREQPHAGQRRARHGSDARRGRRARLVRRCPAERRRESPGSVGARPGPGEDQGQPLGRGRAAARPILAGGEPSEPAGMGRRVRRAGAPVGRPIGALHGLAGAEPIRVVRPGTRLLRARGARCRWLVPAGGPGLAGGLGGGAGAAALRRRRFPSRPWRAAGRPR